MNASILATLLADPYPAPKRVRQALFNAIAPESYPDWRDVPRQVLATTQAFFTGRMTQERSERFALAGMERRRSLQEKDSAMRALNSRRAFSEDAWALYLGLEQPFGVIQPSRYAPQIAKNPSARYYTSDIVRDLFTAKAIREYAKHKGERIGDTNWALGGFQVTHGEDEAGPYISVYDEWNFDIPGERAVGIPFEVYDRVYYDPKTFKPKSVEQVEAARAKNALSQALIKKR